MRRSSSISLLGSLVVLLYLCMAWQPGAASAQGVGLSERGPRFLMAPSSGAAPVEIDARSSAVLRRVVSLKLKQATVGRILNAIERQTGLEFLYSRAILSVDRPVSLRADSITVAAALMEILVDAGVDVLLTSKRQIALIRRAGVRVAEPGAIVGRVTDAKSGQGLAGAEVYLEGTRWRAATEEDGRYRLAGVDAGNYTLTARRVGYGKQSRVVTVADGAEVTIDVTLQPVATQLDEIVTTVTGDQRRVELGHVVGRINADSLVREAPVSTLSELLTGRVPGLVILQSQGTVGGDVQVQVRTPNSLSLSTQPIVIVDGMRYTNTAALDAARSAATGFIIPTGVASVEPTSPLNDLNPNDIETIEVVKGPSAATLYGTDASNGVIVITTKRGRPGRARWNIYVRSSLNETPNLRLRGNYWGWSTLPSGLPSTTSCTLQRAAAGLCIQDSITVIPNPLGDPERTLFASAPRWEYGLNVSGGHQDLRYHFSGDAERAIGPVQLPPAYADSVARVRGTPAPDEQLRPNAFSKINLRSNVAAMLSTRFELQGNVGYVRRANRTMSLTANPYLAANSGPFAAYSSGGLNPAQAFASTSTERVDRFLAGGDAQWRPAAWLRARAAAGLDLTNGTRHSLQRRGEFSPASTGAVENDRTQQRTISADVGVTVSFRRGRIGSRTAVGAQYVRSLNDAQVAWGNNLLPGGESVAQAANRFADQVRSEIATLGSYIEETIGLDDRLFVAGAVRVDGASAFGREYRAAVYPKASVSWLASDDPLFPRLPGLDELRLRYAFGVSGQQARPEMALPTFSTLPGVLEGRTATIVDVSSLGNPQLRPERVREHEFGFDAAVLRSRVRVELTWFRRRTVDQIITQALPPGLGSVFRNVGLTTGRGFEAEVIAQVLDTRNLSWDLSVRHWSNGTRVVDIGDAAELISPLGGYREGFPLGARFHRPLAGYADANGNGVIESAELQSGDTVYAGQITPSHSQALTTVVGLFGRRLRLSAAVERGSGFTKPVAPNECGSGRCLAVLDPNTPLAEQAAALAGAVSSRFDFRMPLVPGNFTRLREVTMALELSSRTLRALRMRSGTLSMSARNLALWTKFPGADPETGFVSGTTTAGGLSSGIPQARSWVLRLDLGF